MSKVIWDCFGFALLRSVIGLKIVMPKPIRRQKITNRDLVAPVIPRFFVFSYFKWVLIDQWCHKPLLCLAIVITLVLRQSLENWSAVDILKLITSLSQSILYCSSMDENKEQSVLPTWNLVFKLELKIILISDYILGSDSMMEWKRKWWNFRRLSCCFYNKLIKHKSKHRNSY